MTSFRTLKQFCQRFKDERATLLATLHISGSDDSFHITMLLMRLMYSYFLQQQEGQEQEAFLDLQAKPELARILAFFDEYQWQLDDRHGEDCLYLDVLGYVFEQQIHQKQMGAYYTQKDVTNYITCKTILPYLLDVLQSVHPSLFLPTQGIWRLLRMQPERYISAALRGTAYLPTETEQEYRTRQLRYYQLYITLQQGRVCTITDVISYNLDIHRFALDMLAACEHPPLLLTLYSTLEKMTILDPTCGTGAFLLAAMTLLGELYTACFQRMQQFVAEQHESRNDDAECCAVFRTLLARATPSRLGASLVNNLYGIDIMPEAVEVCSMQLSLALGTQGVDREHISTLQWNIHTGNALVHETWEKAFPEHRNGFDVIIGNPPYVEYSKTAHDTMINNRNGTYGNLYAEVVERSLLLCRAEASYIGFVVPLSICGGERFATLRRSILTHTSTLWLANFDIFPCRLFEDAYQRLTILLGKQHGQQSSAHETYVTSVQRWYTAERPFLIERIFYTQTRYSYKGDIFPKLASTQQEDILQKMVAARGTLSMLLSPTKTEHIVYYQEATNTWMKATHRIPYYKKNDVVTRPPHGRLLYFNDARTASIVGAVMNSSLFYLWFATYSDGFHLSHALVQSFPVHDALCLNEQLLLLAQRLEEDIQRHTLYSTRNTKRGDSIEIEEYRMVCSKAILDEIDCVLAKQYGFTDEELNFIVQYDSKYRMGKV